MVCEKNALTGKPGVRYHAKNGKPTRQDILQSVKRKKKSTHSRTISIHTKKKEF